MDLGLADTAVLVPASSTGIGRAVAAEFAREGARVAMCSRRREAIEAAAAEIGQRAVHRPHPIVADIATADGCARFVDEALRALGGIDTLVVNTGRLPQATFDQLDDASWLRAVDLFFFPTVRLVRHTLTQLRGSKGSIVLLTAASVRHPGDYPDWAAHVAVRSAVHGLLKVLAKDLAESGVRVNAVQPGAIATHRVATADGDAADTTRSVRWGRAEEVAAVAVFLASRRASFVHGASVVVDGGATSATL